jgi:guanylate kinase
MEHEKATKQGKFVLIIGPSGVGKSVILKRLRISHPELHFPRSATTRQRRENEGNELYHFVNDQEFEDMLKQEKFLESAIVHNVGKYGTMVDEIVPYIEQGKTVVREVDVQGFQSISHNPLFHGPSALYKLQSIFIMPEDRQHLIERIKNRAPISDAELQKRIKSMDNEITFANQCTHTIVNREGKLEDTMKEIERILKEA